MKANAKQFKMIDAVWLALLVGTLLTWWLDASGRLNAPRHGWAVVLIYALAWLKGAAVQFEFMELRHAPKLWRRAMLAALTLMVAGILLAWVLA